MKYLIDKTIKCGIYRITNVIKDMSYIGSSCNLRQRFNLHNRLLRQNKHHSILLQRSYNKYGAENFIVELIEECSKEDLISREQFWLDETQSFLPENGFNICLSAVSPRGTIRSQESIEKTKQTWVRKMAEGYSRPIIPRSPCTEETKKKISAANKGEKHWTFSASDEQKRKIARGHISIIQIDEHGNNIEEFESILDAARKLNLNDSAIGLVLKGKRCHTKGFRFIYRDRESNLKDFPMLPKITILKNEIILYQGTSSLEGSKILGVCQRYFNKRLAKGFYKDYILKREL